MRWPHNEWWQDRDRIVLLHEYISYYAPDGTFAWEVDTCSFAILLWSDGREGSSELHPNGVGKTSDDDIVYDRMGWSDFANEPAPGWRMLTSLPSCPNPHMRFPMSRDLFGEDRVECDA